MPIWTRPPEAFAHATRARYVAGCRCADCRSANAADRRTRVRSGTRNPLVGARPAARHLRRLARAGVGIRSVAATADLHPTFLRLVRAGARPHLRAQTAARILAVTARAARPDRFIVPAAQTWAWIRALTAEGFTQRRLARELGYQAPALQLGRTVVYARTEARVGRLYRRLMA